MSAINKVGLDGEAFRPADQVPHNLQQGTGPQVASDPPPAADEPPKLGERGSFARFARSLKMEGLPPDLSENLDKYLYGREDD